MGGRYLLCAHLVACMLRFRGEQAEDAQRGGFDVGVVVAQALGELSDALAAQEEDAGGRRALYEGVEGEARVVEHLFVNVGEATQQQLERLRAGAGAGRAA
jgi:hypothetical protein